RSRRTMNFSEAVLMRPQAGGGDNHRLGKVHRPARPQSGRRRLWIRLSRGRRCWIWHGSGEGTKISLILTYAWRNIGITQFRSEEMRGSSLLALVADAFGE